MRFALGTGGSRAPRRLPPLSSARVAPALLAALAPALLLTAVLLLAASCSSSSGAKSGITPAGGPNDPNAKTVLLTRKGESSIQVTESELDGNQIVRVNTVFRGQESTIVLDIDLPVYEVEIPLSLEQVMPQSASAQVRGPEGQFQDLLIAQWLQKAQEAMLQGDYNAALRQVDTVLQVQPNHIPARTMKGSVYYALGNYELANQEWEYVLGQDPSNKEVQEFKEFLRNRSSGQAPKLPGAPPGTQTPPPARGSGGGAAPRPPAAGQGGTPQ